MKYRRFVERALLLVVSLGSVYFVAFTAYSDFKSTRQRALFYQLQILRMGVNIHQLVLHNNPANLLEVVTKTYRLRDEPVDRKFVEGIAIDTHGRIFDPFGNPYFYDPVTGWVRSTTSGYEFW